MFDTILTFVPDAFVLLNFNYKLFSIDHFKTEY